MTLIQSIVSHIAGRAEPAPRRTAQETAQTPAAAASARGSDRVDLSDEARGLAGHDQPIRADLVARVRAELAAGTYETDDKLDAAVDRLSRDLA